MNPPCVRLLNGGVDSRAATAWAIEQGWTVNCLTIWYYQVKRETQHASRVALALSIAFHKEIDIGGFGKLSQSGRTHAEHIADSGLFDPSSILEDSGMISWPILSLPLRFIFGGVENGTSTCWQNWTLPRAGMAGA